MPKPLEPTLETLSNPFLRYFAATRPAFLSVTFVGCLLGLATAAWSGIAVGPALATVTLFFALMAHAGANVINDYYDALSGCDGANTERVASGLGFALLVANVLYINQFPDVKADAGAGKNTLVVRLGVARARWGYVLIAALAYGWPLLMVLLGQLPLSALLALLPAAASIAATRRLWSCAGRPAELTPALKLTILAASAHGLLLAIVLSLPWSPAA